MELILVQYIQEDMPADHAHSGLRLVEGSNRLLDHFFLYWSFTQPSPRRPAPYVGSCARGWDFVTFCSSFKHLVVTGCAETLAQDLLVSKVSI